jgi:transcriptional regulator with XRE-family HTH domain
MTQKDETKNFSENLKTLCGYYKSVSEVCRKIGLNRQQFNRYLNGSTFPAYANLKAICDFFGVDQEEIISQPEVFKKTISPTAAPEVDSPLPSDLLKHIESMRNGSSTNLEHYTGYYYRYILSASFPGYIFRSLLRVYKKDDFYYFWHIERATSDVAVVEKTFNMRYHGVVFMLSDRIYIIELESVMNSTLSETIMTPSYRPGNRNLYGVSCYSTSDRLHRPVATRTFHEFIGKKIHIRDRLKECNLFPLDSDAISDSVKEAIINPSISSTDVLTCYQPGN